MIILGVDCGLDGALAFLDHSGAMRQIEDMPTLTIARGGKARRKIDICRVVQIIAEMAPGHAYVEQIWGRGHSADTGFSSASLLIGYGNVQGIIGALGIPTTETPPQRWKKALGVPAEKDGARARASQLLPAAAVLWPLKKHDGRAEAALIALYGIRQLGSVANGGEISTGG